MKKITILLITLIILVFISLIILEVQYKSEHECGYELDNGVLCKNEHTGFGASKLSRCSDGKVYVNVNYKWVCRK